MSFSVGGPCVFLCRDQFPSDSEETTTEKVSEQTILPTENQEEVAIMVLNYESNSAHEIVESYKLSFIEVHSKSFYTAKWK